MINKPNEQTVAIRAIVEFMLTFTPGLTRREMTKPIAIETGLTVKQIGWKIASMVNAGDIRIDRKEPRKCRYYLTDDDRPKQRIVPVTETVSRILSGPVKSPMEWSRDCLANATM